MCIFPLLESFSIVLKVCDILSNFVCKRAFFSAHFQHKIPHHRHHKDSWVWITLLQLFAHFFLWSFNFHPHSGQQLVPLWQPVPKPGKSSLVLHRWAGQSGWTQPWLCWIWACKLSRQALPLIPFVTSTAGSSLLLLITSGCDARANYKINH